MNERKEDYLKVTIYYKSLTVKQTYESALISVSDKFILYKFTIKLNNFQTQMLLPQVGGALSLFLGIAIIMAFEILELILDLLTETFQFCTQSRRGK